MAEQKLTPWFPGDVKPVRKGVYQRKYAGYVSEEKFVAYSFWNGHFWGNWRLSPEGAITESQAKWQGKWPWRGVAK